jgi:hypothetical protein
MSDTVLRLRFELYRADEKKLQSRDRFEVPETENSPEGALRIEVGLSSRRSEGLAPEETG